jgi:hypothetical protein
MTKKSNSACETARREASFRQRLATAKVNSAGFKGLKPILNNKLHGVDAFLAAEQK